VLSGKNQGVSGFLTPAPELQISDALPRITAQLQRELIRQRLQPAQHGDQLNDSGPTNNLNRAHYATSSWIKNGQQDLQRLPK
jgi:hypothetical protein